MELLVLAGLAAAAIVGWWHWEHHVRQIPLARFGILNVNHVLAREPLGVQHAIRLRGSMTYAQWHQITKAQLDAIDKQIAQRKYD